MENATDALIMAGSVLLLIIALTVTISSLTALKTETQDMLNDRDQLLATTEESGYINYLKSGGEESDTRIVGIETVMSSIRRMAKEDYTVYIKTNNPISELNNDLKVNGDSKFIKLSLSGVGNKYVNDKNVTSTIYSKLNLAKFKEYIGIYQNKTAEGVSDANKATYKIITYEQQ